MNGEWVKMANGMEVVKGVQGTWYRIGGIVWKVPCEYGSQECTVEEH